MKRVMVVVIALVTIGSTQAQITNPQCDHQAIYDIYQRMVLELSEAVPAVDAQDAAGFFDVLDDMVSEYHRWRTWCKGLTFSSATNGFEAIVDVTLPEGVYIFRLRSDGDVTARLTEVEGRCPFLIMTMPYDNDELYEEATTATAHSDCKALIEIDNGFLRNDAPWVLSIEPIRYENEPPPDI